jgi:hypothetical protein
MLKCVHYTYFGFMLRPHIQKCAMSPTLADKIKFNVDIFDILSDATPDDGTRTAHTISDLYVYLYVIRADESRPIKN